MMDKNLQPKGLSIFFGGWSSDKKLGDVGQFYYSRSVDFRKKPSSFTLLPQPRKADNGVVDGLVLAMDQINSGVRYAADDAGKIYKLATDDNWSVVSTIGQAGGAGALYRADVDHFYFTGQTKISRIKRVSDDAIFEPNWFDIGISNSSTCFKAGGGQTYALPTILSESAKRSFTSDIEPLYQIGIRVINKGTGDWILTLHDDANDVLGTVTILNANLKNNQINYFVFSSPLRIQRGDNGGGSALTYHFHLTSTIADGTIATTTAGSMADCDMELWATALVPTQNNLHPTINFSNFTLVGNGRYVATYEPLQDNPTTADFNRHRLTLPPGFEVCGFGQKNLMCVIGAEKRSASGEFQEGMLFFWDGIADAYNDFWPVPEGSPESLFSHKNVVYFIAGGAVYRMRGGDEPIKIRTFRNTDSEYSDETDITHVYPHMMTVRRGVLLMGYPSLTTNEELEHGVHSYGSIDRGYPDSFGFSYPLSTGTLLNNGSNNLKIGMVKNYGDTLYISWRDDSASPQKYGVDVVDNTSDPARFATLESLQFDNGQPYKYKRGAYMLATFYELPPGTSVKLKWKIDGEADWHYSEEKTSGTYLVSPINQVSGVRYLAIQFGIDIACAGSVSPEITGLFLLTDLLPQGRPIGG